MAFDPITFVTTLVSSVASSLGVGGLVLHWFKQRSDRELEGIKGKNAQQIEHLKTYLLQRHYQFSRSYDRQAETLENVYLQLTELRRVTEDATQLLDNPNNPALTKLYQSKMDEFQKYFTPRQIYLPKCTAKQIIDAANKLHNLMLQYGMTVRAEDAGVGQKVLDERRQKLEEAYQDVRNVLDTVSDEFQWLLGISNEKRGADSKMTVADLDRKAISDAAKSENHVTPRGV